MPKNALLFALLYLTVSVPLVFAQCIDQSTGTTSTRLVCLTPELYGASLNKFVNPPEFQGGITLSPTVPQHFAHFTASSIQSFTALNTAIGTQLSLLPLVTPAAGVSFTFAGGVVTQASNSFGPIMGERGETLGRRRLHVGVMFQRFQFDEIDGISLDHIPAVFSHFLSRPPATSRYENDVITTDNRIDLKVNQWTGVATYGVTNRVDVSIAVPILDVRLGVGSKAAIITAPGSFQDCVKDFPAITSGDCHSFTNGTDNAAYYHAGAARGLGDIVLRVKGQVIKGERAAVALGGDLRLPTGDEQNFLGAGATGFRPFVAMSYRGRVTPHIDFGYEWNGSSILAGQMSASGVMTKGRLPDQVFYVAGADVGITHKLTGAIDLVGQRLISAPRIFRETFTTTGGITLPNISQGHQSFEMDNLSLGLKYAPVSRLTLTANVMFRVDNAGLRAKAVPLVGMGYTF